jgi:hypothetical protein
MIIETINILFDFLIFFITFASNVISSLRHRNTPPTESLSIRLQRLQNERSELIIQRENLSIKITDIESSIKDIQLSIADTRNIARTPSRDTLHQRGPDTASSSSLHPVSRLRPRARRSTVGIPYPTPYTPPRTPEEERRNRVVEWLNELRLQRHAQNGDPR